MTPSYPHIDHALTAAARVLGKPNRGAALILAAFILSEGTGRDDWTPDRYAEAMALLVAAATRPIPEHIDGRLRVAVRLMTLAIQGRTADAADLFLLFALRKDESAADLRAWLTEPPPIPSKTLRRRAKLAARATLTQGSRP